MARQHTGAALAYTLLALLFIDHGTSLTTSIFGHGGDPYQFIWFLRWWPWALAHHQSLFASQLIWQPLGLRLLWVTSIPLLSLAMAPVTVFGGPVLAYNLLILLSPVLSAWCAYRLCRHLVPSFWPAWLGGCVFGFSAAETAMDYATPNLSVNFLLPLLVWLALCRLEGGISRPAAVALATLMMAAEFFISIEVFAVSTVFGGLAWLLAYILLPAQRLALRTLCADALLAGALTTLFLSPSLAAMFSGPRYSHNPDLWPYFFAADPVNFIIPTPFTWLGGQAAAPISAHFPGINQERGSYLGLPLCAALWAYIRQNGRNNLLSWLLVLFAILSLGPALWFGGHYTGLPLPWALAVHLPLIGEALPARFALYVSLVSALILPLWITADPAQRRLRAAWGVIACLALLPAPHPFGPVPHATFFQPGRIAQVLGPDPTLLVLPFGGTGPSTYWQVEAGFSYRQTGGYLGFPPLAMQHYAAVPQLFGNYQRPSFAADLADFAQSTHTDDVVAGPGTPPAVLAALSSLGWRRRDVDDVTLFQVPK